MYSIIHLPGLGMRSLQAVPQSDSHGMPGCFDVRCVSASMESWRGLGTEMGLSEKGTLWWTNIAIENGPFIDGLPIKHGDFPLLC